MLLYDESIRPRLLSRLWSLSSRLDTSTRIYGVSSWDELYARLELIQRAPGPIRELQLWCDEWRSVPQIADQIVDLLRLADALGVDPSDPEPHLELVWFRCCDVARSWDFMRAAARVLGCPVAAHTVAVCGPLTLRQRGLCVVTPADAEHPGPWYGDGASLPAASALQVQLSGRVRRRAIDQSAQG